MEITQRVMSRKHNRDAGKHTVVQGIRSIIGKYKIDREMLKIV